MPRIRKLKIYDQIIPASTWTQRGDEEDAEQGYDQQTTNQTLVAGAQTDDSYVEQHGGYAVSGWYSDASVIATMPDAKLREAYFRYRNLARACNEEIIRRRITNTHIRATAEFDVVAGMHRFVPVRGPSRYTNSPRKRKGQSKGQGQIELTPEQMLKALQMLFTLKNKG